MIHPQVKARLESMAIDYCVIGAAALAAHGVARFSVDLDLLTFDSRVLEPDFWQLPADVRRGAHDDPFEGVVRIDAGVPHDVLVGRGRAMRRALMTAELHPRFGCKVATADALILLKLIAGGPIDVQDIHALLHADVEFGDATLTERVEAVLLPPDAQTLWQRIRTEHTSSSP